MKKDANLAVVVGWDRDVSQYAHNLPGSLRHKIESTMSPRIGEIAGTRDYILSRWPPRHQNVYARYVTLARDVGPGYNLPIAPQRITVWGTHEGNGTQSLAVMIGDPGRERVSQPNGRLFHITISVADGVPPAEAGKFTWDQVKNLDVYEELWGYAHFLPTWRITPERREIALVG